MDIFDYVKIEYACEFCRENWIRLNIGRKRFKDDLSSNRSCKNYRKVNIVSIERLGQWNSTWRCMIIWIYRMDKKSLVNVHIRKAILELKKYRSILVNVTYLWALLLRAVLKVIVTNYWVEFKQKRDTKEFWLENTLCIESKM